MVVEEPKTVNLTIPLVVRRWFEATAGDYGNKQKWAVATGAMLALAALPEDFRRHLISHVLSAGAGVRSYEELIADVQSGNLRREFDERKARGLTKAVADARPPTGGRSSRAERPADTKPH